MENQITKKEEGIVKLNGLFKKWKNYREMKKKEREEYKQKKNGKGCVFCWSMKRTDDTITKETVEELTQMLEEYKEKIGLK